MAPEQIRGEPVGPATDIYAFGVLAYQLLAGRPPFMGDTAYVLHAHAYEQPAPLRQIRPDLPEWVCVPVDAALAKEPVRRPSSAMTLARPFDRALLPHPEPSSEQLFRQSLALALADLGCGSVCPCRNELFRHSLAKALADREAALQILRDGLSRCPWRDPVDELGMAAMRDIP
jgi:serine/threonine protein kinase